jgi:sugar/nucleoside kinase (ribokinase family)
MSSFGNINSTFGSGYINIINTNNNYFFKDNNYKERPERFSIIGIGDCMVDINTEINAKIIQDYQLDKDMTKYTNDNTKNIFDELNRLSTVHYIPGGSIQNTLRALSFILKKNQALNNINNSVNNINLNANFNISMLGCLGGDKYNEKIINSLIQSGIKPIIKVTNEETSRCAAGFYNKKPFLISEIKASKNCDNEFILSNKENILKHEILLIEGYYIQHQFELCKLLCELFQKEKDKLIILTLSPIKLNQYLDENFVIIANYADIIFSSKSQAEEFACSKGGEKEKILIKIFKKFSHDKKRLLIIKDGKESSYCAEYDYINNHLKYIFTCFSNPIKNDEIVDEIGLEDAFLGGFLFGYMKGESLYNCLKKGNDLAITVLKNIGCTFER